MKSLKPIGNVMGVLLIATLVASFLLPAVPLTVSADTTVGGQITSDTIWTKANSPYIVTSNVLVTEGVTLTIEPGVVVKFESGKAIQIDGELIARGTEVEPIVFTSNQASPAPGDWCNILFTDSSIDATYDEEGNYLSGCILQYCTVEYGGSGDAPAVKIVSSSLFIDHCIIANNNSSGIYVDGGSAKITNNIITNNASTGIYGDEFDELTINCNTISSNASEGICARAHPGATLIIGGNTVANNSGGGVYSDIFDESVVSMSGNTISHNSAAECGGGIQCWNQGVVTISGNVISNNSAKLGGEIYANSGTVIISGNTISNNSASDNGGGIYAEGTATIISHNEITGNSTGSGIYIYRYGQPTINYNHISDNAPYDVYNEKEAGATVVDVTHNWWGTTDEATIQAHIYDWYDDASLGIVDYIPYLTAEVDSTPPTTPVVTDDGDTTTSTTELHATWTSSDSESGIAEYQYAIGTSAGETDVVAWTSAGTNIEVTKSGLNLTVGTTYYFAVKAKNGQGLWSEVGTSDGITVSDITPPTTPVVTDDGDTTTNATQLHASWSSSDSESGIAEYQYAIGTSAGGTDVVPWTSAGTDTEVTHTDLNLTVGTTYYFAVKAQNGQGLWSEVGVSDGITVSDITPPTTPVVTDDGDTTTSTTELHATWISSDPELGIAEYQYAIGTSAGGTDVVPWTSAGTDTEVTHTGLNLTVGATYYFAVKAQNGQGLWSEAGTSDGITVSDITPPTTPVVTDDGDTTTSTTQLHATWTSSDPESGIAEYQYAIGTSAGGTDVVPWTSAGINTEVTHTGLNLTVGTTYYFAVKAQNGQGLWSEVGVSDGITITDSTPPTTPVVTDDGDTTTSTTELHASWSSSDGESGIAEYQHAIGTSAGGTDVVDWTSAGINTEVTHTGLNLTVGTTYYFAVKAKNGEGLWSEAGVSDGITVGNHSVSDGDEGKIAGLPFWGWIAIGVVVVLIIGVVIGRRLAHKRV